MVTVDAHPQWDGETPYGETEEGEIPRGWRLDPLRLPEKTTIYIAHIAYEAREFSFLPRTFSFLPRIFCLSWTGGTVT